MSGELAFVLVMIVIFVSLWFLMAWYGAFNDLFERAAMIKKARDGWERDE